MLEKTLFYLIGGLGLFLLGMRIMSEGLQKMARERIRRILAALTTNRFVGVLVGLAVTGIIQSSSATTVMLVSFVNAGLMNLSQAVSVIMGANIGTTVTGQIIAFKITKYALPCIGVGMGIRLFSRWRRWTFLGEALVGFGLVFFGLHLMKEAFVPLRSSPIVLDYLATFSKWPLAAVLAGTALTLIIQSSSATVGITMTLASSGLITYPAAVAMVLGENIGTTVTANLASIGTNLGARRTARAHFLFNCFGVAYMMLLFPWYYKFIDWMTPGSASLIASTAQQAAALGVSLGEAPYVARHIANAHTVFNLANTLVFIPIMPLLVKVAERISPPRPGDEAERLVYLDTRMVDTPGIAMQQAHLETVRMAGYAKEMYQDAVAYLLTEDEKRLKEVSEKEEIVDLLHKEITDFLVGVSQQSISRETSQQIRSTMRVINNLEKIGDHAENVSKLAQRKIDQRLPFSPFAMKHMEEISLVGEKFLGLVTDAFRDNNPDIAEETDHLETELDRMETVMRDDHIKRLEEGICRVDSGMVFIDLLSNFEKIGDHAYNIAEAVMGKK
jgi:phosphate:Na+ symporter